MMCIAIANVCPNTQAHFGRYVLPNPRKIKRITLIYWMVRDMAKPDLTTVEGERLATTLVAWITLCEQVSSRIATLPSAGRTLALRVLKMYRWWDGLPPHPLLCMCPQWPLSVSWILQVIGDTWQTLMSSVPKTEWASLKAFEDGKVWDFYLEHVKHRIFDRACACP